MINIQTLTIIKLQFFINGVIYLIIFNNFTDNVVHIIYYSLPELLQISLNIRGYGKDGLISDKYITVTVRVVLRRSDLLDILHILEGTDILGHI